MNLTTRWIAKLVAVVSSLLVVAIPLVAEPPADISYQGQLLATDGNPLEGPVNLQIRIYESFAPSPGEVALFVEDHPKPSSPRVSSTSPSAGAAALLGRWDRRPSREQIVTWRFT